MHRVIIILYLSIFAATSAHAQGVLSSDFTAANLYGSPLALGGAYRALANDNSAMTINPAGILRADAFSANANWVTSEFNDTLLLSAGVVDSEYESGYAIGFHFDYSDQTIFGNSVDFTQYTLAFATTLLEGLRAGINLKYYNSSIGNPLLGGPDGVTSDFGLIYDLGQYVGVALTLQNFLDGTTNPNVPMLFGGGIIIRPDPRAAILVDVVQDFSTPNPEQTNVHVGGQIQLSNDYAFRTGFGWDRVRDDSFLGAGLLVTAPKAWLGFTYARRFTSNSDTFSVYVELKF